MPLTPFQKEVIHLLAANRKPGSHIGGGAAINRSGTSPRFSADLDVFHDAADAVLVSADADAALLTAHGFSVQWLTRESSLQRARIARNTDTVRLDWTFDSEVRFFPIQPDPEFGFCLHIADLATNKALALVGRSEIRDYFDILYLHETYLSLGAVLWAACGKDQGFTPWSLLDHAQRHMKFRNEDLQKEVLLRPISLQELKETWLAIAAQAGDFFGTLPIAEMGCLYLDKTGTPVTPDPTAPDFLGLTRHFGSVRGAWPSLA